MISMSEAAAYLGSEERPYPVEAVRPTPRRVLEVGSGVGNGTIQAALAWPEATFTCLEPDDVARNTLAWRLAANGLGDRVSILPLRLEETEFLGTFDVVLAQHVLCEIAPQDRPAFLTALSRRMGYDGAAVIDDHFGPTANEAVARTEVGQARFGEFTYTQWFTATPGKGSTRSAKHEIVMRDRRGDVIDETTHETVEYVTDPELAHSLIRAAGMVPASIGDGWLRLATP